MSLGFCRRYESERSSARILIVDTDRGSTAVLASVLADWGCEVSYAFDARLALLYARKCRPQVTLLDLGTPRVNRTDFASAFRNATAVSGCALIGLSTDPDRASDEVSGHLGLNGFLAKPVETLELEAAIQPFVTLTKGLDATVAVPRQTTIRA